MQSLVDKPWGSYEIIEQADNYLVKKIIVNPQSKLSLQSHDHRSEHWIIVEGTAEVTINDEVTIVECNHSIFIPQNSKHSLANNKDSTLIVIEVWYGDKLSEDDIIRYKDIYGRV